MYKSSSNLKIWSSWIQKLQCLQERPSIFSHYISSNNARGTALAPYRMNENTLGFVDSIIYKIKNLVCRLILGVKKNLIFLVHPIVSEVDYSYWFPMIWYLFSSTVNNMSDFVCNDELQILIINSVSHNKGILLPMQQIHLL